ncbi:MAG: alpha/beta hydrolase [Xanthobacteraceae bacterium]
MTIRTTTTGAAHPLAAAGTTAVKSIDTPAGSPPAYTTPAVSGKARRLRAYVLGISAAVSSRIRTKAPRLSSMPRGLTVLGWAAVIAVCVYAGLTAMIYFAQRSLMYFPDRTYTSPAAAGLPEASEVPLTTSDGLKIHVWQVPPQPGKPVILYFHGNGGSLRYRVERFRRLIGAGIGLVALEYRGYGGLSGNPTERGLIRDAEAAYAYTAARYPTPQIVVWGESLGTGVAVALAAEKPVGRLILEAPFTSALAIAESRYWYLPVRLLMKDQFRSDERIKRVTAPLLILHGVDDRVVPFSMGEHMFELANKPKHIVRFLDGGHEDLDQNGALDAVARFLAGDLD